MNFKVHFFYLTFAIIFSSCGVKGDPIPPPGTEIPPWQDQFFPPEELATPTPTIPANE